MTYAKGMAVEFAHKTTNGTVIDDKFESTDSAMELLQQAIEGKIGFDGEYKGAISTYQPPTGVVLHPNFKDYLLNFDSGNYVIKIINSVGAYIALAQISIPGNVKKYSLYVFTGRNTLYYSNNNSTVSFINDKEYPLNFITEYDNIVLGSSQWDTTPTEGSKKVVTSGGIYSFVKPIYWHGINMYKDSDSHHYTCQFHILNNSPVPINSVAKVEAWILATGITRLLIACNGCFFESENTGGTLHAIVYDRTRGIYEIYYIDSTGSHKVESATLSTYFNCSQDYTNKIN